MNYPARGETSEDRRYYTHTDGTVYELVPFDGCSKCSFLRIDMCRKVGCGNLINGKMAMFKRVEGAYVESAEEIEACGMARSMIDQCGNVGYFKRCTHDANLKCARILDKSCPARAYLEKHGAADAWEVK